jgi:heme exporter protein A
MSTPTLSVHDLACARGDRLLFKGMNFSVKAGELLLVQGGNGQGKTSLLRLLTGLSRPDQGEVRWDVVVTNRAGETVAAYDLLTMNAA